MLISCIIVSHNKPRFVLEAIRSVVDQTYADWQLVLIDSGVLFDQGFFAGLADPRIKLIRSWETEEMRESMSMAPFLYNHALRHCVEGEIVCFLGDDDLWRPGAFLAFVRAFQSNPAWNVCFGHQDLALVDAAGVEQAAGQRRAFGALGAAAGKHSPDCIVDSAQAAYRTAFIRRNGLEWSAALKDAYHADGLFLQACSALSPLWPIDEVVSCNRRTPISRYGPSR